ncbi:MAG: ComEC/Rec2 family competence protein [Marmoricola sp.]
MTQGRLAPHAGPTDGRTGDERLLALGLLAWVAALAAARPAVLAGLLLGLALGWAALLRRGPATLTRTLLAWLLVAASVGGGALLRHTAVQVSPVTTLAGEGAVVRSVVVVSGDPRTVHGRFGDRVLVNATVLEVTGRGRTWRLRAPVAVLGPSDGVSRWRAVRHGAHLAVVGRLAAADQAGGAPLLLARGTPTVLAGPGTVDRAVDRVRAGIRRAVADRAPGPRALVPALVDGDDATMPADLQQAFRATGLSHLLAVSGTNLTLVVGFLLVVARGVGVRARGLVGFGALGVIGFVLLARAEPSVVRAAAMGSVALLGMGTAGRGRGVRAWGGAVLALMLVDPGLARSAGFALSALATLGILLLAPPWRDALVRWAPRWVAEAVAVPLAAQVACTPVIAALFGQVSVVAVVANLLAAPVVGVATVLGLLGGLVAVVVAPAGALLAAPAAWSAGWIITVARTTAALPVASVTLPTGAATAVLTTLGCLALVGTAGLLLGRPRWALVAGALLVAAVLVPLPDLGWPPRGWVLVACDVGQGDALVLAAGPHAGVLVDAGPDPAAVDRCLHGLGITRLPLVVLTHFHADHVDGLPGALAGRRVGGIEVSPYEDPAGGAALVHRVATAERVPVATATWGDVRTLGPLRWQVLAPSGPAPADSDSPPNDDSVVLYVETHGLRVLMMGDEETGSQQRLHALYPRLRADVLKVAHHGSAKQDPALVESLGARWGLISVGAHNDYGHPAPSTLRLLSQARIAARRTDLDGDLAVVVDHGVRVVGHG